MSTLRNRDLLDTAWRLAACSCCGIAFGVAMEKGRVFEPQVIRGQMDMSKFIMLKMFMSAVASGGIGLLALKMLPATRGRFAVARKEYLDSLWSDKGVLTSAAGAALLGCGITLAGACPGMVLIQVGTGVPNALLTFLGCLSGALLYGLVAKKVISMTRPAHPLRHPTVDGYLGMSYASCIVPLCAALATAVAALEMWVPWQSEVPLAFRWSSASGLGSLSSFAWPPYLAGIVIGALQVPIALTVGDTLGGSSSYCTMVSQLVPNPPPYLAKYKRFCLDNWWQVVYVTSAIVGGALSVHWSGSNALHSVAGVDPLHAFLGGALMVFGARLAAGCTSGHGLSGLALLSSHSFIAVPCMFLSAMATSWLLF